MYFDFRKYVIAALLTALVWIMALTPLGYIPLFGVDVTLMCIPVIVGTCALGLQYGLFLGFMFALTSLFMALMGRAGVLLSPLLNFPLAMYPTIFVPRLLIPIVTWLVYKTTKKLNVLLSYGLSALVGSFVNTLFFLSFAYILGANPLTEIYQISSRELLSSLGAIAKSNGLLEAAVSVIVCVPVLDILKRTFNNHGEALEH